MDDTPIPAPNLQCNSRNTPLILVDNLENKNLTCRCMDIQCTARPQHKYSVRW